MAASVAYQNKQAETQQTFQAEQALKQQNFQTKMLKRQKHSEVKTAMVEAKSTIKQMRDDVNICKFIEHFESELLDAEVPLKKRKKILASKLSHKAEKKCAHLIYDADTTYGNLKYFLLRNIGPGPDELCNIVHGTAENEFKDRKETDKLAHAKYLAERYMIDAELDEDVNQTVVNHIAVRLYKHNCDRRFSNTIKLVKNPTLEKVFELAAAFDGQIDYEKTRIDKEYRHSYKKTHSQRPFCTYCRKTGHAEADCYRKQNDSKSEQQKSDTPKQDRYRSDKQQYKPRQQDFKKNKEQYRDAGVKTRPVSINWNQTTEQQLHTRQSKWSRRRHNNRYRCSNYSCPRQICV